MDPAGALPGCPGGRGCGSMRRWLQLLVVGLWCAWSGASHAHKPSDSYLVLQQPRQGSSIEGQWDIALRDLQHAMNLDINGDGQITWGELKARQTAVRGYAFSKLTIEAIARGDRGSCPLRPDRLLF